MEPLKGQTAREATLHAQGEVDTNYALAAVCSLYGLGDDFTAGKERGRI
jgi:hypothetical protein